MDFNPRATFPGFFVDIHSYSGVRKKQGLSDPGVLHRAYFFPWAFETQSDRKKNHRKIHFLEGRKSGLSKRVGLKLDYVKKDINDPWKA